eukprot:7616332-Pyramimonas_sp.AAC.1
MASGWPKRAPKGAQGGPKTAPRTPKTAPRAAHEGPKRFIFGPRRGDAVKDPPVPDSTMSY